LVECTVDVVKGSEVRFTRPVVIHQRVSRRIADMKVKGANTERTMRAVNVARTTNVTDSARLSLILNVFSRSHSMQSVQKCVM